MYSVGIIGCGRIASEFEDDPARQHPCTHAGAYSILPQTKIVCAADVHKEKLKKFAKRWKVPKIYTDYEKMIAENKIDIVSVCTPPETHAQIVVNLANSGVKAIFCEKPMATSVREAVKMVKECKKHGVQLTVNHLFRWHTHSIRMKEMLLTKRLGNIVKINGGYSSGLFTVGTHAVDLLTYFCGPVKKVMGTPEDTSGVSSLWYSENYKPSDPPVSGILWFKNGVIGQLFSSCKTKYPFFEITAFTTYGRLTLDEIAFTKYRLRIYEYAQKRLRLQKEFLKENNLMLSAVKDILSSLRKNRQTASSGEDALHTMLILEALAKSAAKNRPVPVLEIVR